MTMSLPNFFIVGAPKCGTTTLYEWLGDHPSICGPHKEPCFFSQDIFPTASLATHIRSLEEYCRIFALKPPQRISGEATPKYLYSDQALDQIAALQPNARIIVCLRDPVELAVSLYNQKLREGVETLPTFEQAWAASLAALDSDDHDLPHERHYYLWACVGSRLRELHARFAPESILIILTTELRCDPRRCYLKVLSFLGLSDDGRSDFSARNERLAIRSLTLHRTIGALRRLSAPVLLPLHRLRSGRGIGILKLVNWLNTHPGRYTSSVSEALKQDMYDLLSDEIDLAESYLDGRMLVTQRSVVR